jgi:uncharacterized protein YjiK
MRLFSFSVLLLWALAETLSGCLGDTTGNPDQDAKKKNKDKDESSFDLNIPEPSGLSFTVSGDALYTVSDKNGGIYKISFTGDVIEKIPSGAHDLEGIAIDKSNGDIWVVEEKQQRIFRISKDGRILNKISDIHIKTKDNSGFEGIAINNHLLYILVEKNPGILIVYNISLKTWDKYKLSFADDYSGIDFDVTDNTLWIVSDESKTLNHCNLDGTLIESQKIDISQAEGVAVNRQANIAWVISDSGHKLHRIKIKI